MIITDNATGTRWIVERIDADNYRATYQEFYSGAGWKSIGPPEILSAECVAADMEALDYGLEIDGGF